MSIKNVNRKIRLEWGGNMLRKNCLQKTSTNGHVNTDVVNQTQDLFTSSQRQKDVFE